MGVSERWAPPARWRPSTIKKLDATSKVKPNSEKTLKINTDRDRYLIITTGRSGSNLFAAICADAGANFDIPGLQHQEPSNFRAEHLTLIAAYKWLSRSQKLENSLLPATFAQRFCERMMNKRLSAVVEKTPFLKSSILVWLVHPIYKLGYRPYIIVAYRKFTGYGFEKYRKNGWSVPDLIATYTKVYSTALLQLTMFGGCAVSYEEVTDKEETGWAKAVSDVTGLDYERLLESRDRLVQPVKQIDDVWVFGDERTQSLYAQLQQLKGKVIEPNL